MLLTLAGISIKWTFHDFQSWCQTTDWWDTSDVISNSCYKYLYNIFS